MLKQSFLRTLHHRIGFLMFQEHSHHGTLGNKGMYPVQKLPIPRILQHLLPESRTVVIVYPAYTFPYVLPAADCCIDCQITALGMAGRIKLPRAELSYLL